MTPDEAINWAIYTTAMVYPKWCKDDKGFTTYAYERLDGLLRYVKKNQLPYLVWEIEEAMKKVKKVM